jgi:hypothetical protein
MPYPLDFPDRTATGAERSGRSMRVRTELLDSVFFSTRLFP